MTEYDNGYKYQIALNNTICEYMFPAAFLLSFQIVRLYQVCLSVMAILSISYFSLFCRKYLQFHFNVKILFYYQFVTCFFHASVVLISQTYQLILTLSAKQYCDVVLTPPAYQILHTLHQISLISTISSIIAMFCEIAVSTCFLPLHAKLGHKIGIVLLFFAVFNPCVIAYSLLANKTFDYPEMTSMTTPKSINQEVNAWFQLVIFIFLILVVFSAYFYKHNKKRNSSIQLRASFTLSSQYQIRENVVSSRILFELMNTQLVLFLIYGVSMYLIRIYIPLPKPPKWKVISEIIYTPPLYCAIMPILCIYTIRKSQKSQNRNITQLIKLRSTGTEGWHNYQKMLNDQWA